MTVIQGPLVNDHVSVNPSTFLEAWIAGTQVFGLGPGAFKGGSLQFVISSTNPPDLNHRAPGQLWFKRGDGRLYIWDQSDLPSGVSDAGVQNVNWLSLSDRRDMWAEVREQVFPGSPLFLAGTPSGIGQNLFSITGASLTTFVDDVFHGRTIWTLSIFGGSVPQTGIKGNQTFGPVFVALESAASGARTRVSEWGWCDVLMASGETGTAGPLAWDATASNSQWFRLKQYTVPSLNANTPKWSYVGYVFDTSASDGNGAPWVRRAWKHPMGCWDPACGTLA